MEAISRESRARITTIDYLTAPTLPFNVFARLHGAAPRQEACSMFGAYFLTGTRMFCRSCLIQHCDVADRGVTNHRFRQENSVFDFC